MNLVILVSVLELIISCCAEKVILMDTKSDGWGQWNKNTDKFRGWRIQNLPPNGDAVYGVCEIRDSSTDNWLRSPLIQRKQGVSLFVELLFTMRKCDNPPATSHCEETFTMLKYESDQDTDDIQFNMRYFEVVHKVSPNRKWEKKDRTENILNRHVSVINVRRSGIILAFQNTGSCVMLKEVQVYYNQCERLPLQLVEFGKTTSLITRTSVVGNCVDGATHIQQHSQPMSNQISRNIINYCLSNGRWEYSGGRLQLDLSTINGLPNICHCSPGFEPENKFTQCSKCKYDHYKADVGLSPCVHCPSNSYSSQGSSKCFCKSGFYNVPKKDQSLICRSPPAKPPSISIEAEDQARIIIHWLPSPQQTYLSTNPSIDANIESDSPSDIYYNISCINCPNKLQYKPSNSIIGNRVEVLGALPSREYNFKITTVNEVSKYVNNPFDIEQSSNKVSTLTQPLESSIITLKIVSMTKLLQHKSIVIKWTTIAKMNLQFLEFECVVLGFNSIPSEYELRFPEYHNFQFTRNIQLEIKVPLTKYKLFMAKVRSRTENGWGQYSFFSNISTNNQSSKINSMPKKPSTQDKSHNPNLSNIIGSLTNSTPKRIAQNISRHSKEEFFNSNFFETFNSTTKTKFLGKDVFFLIAGTIFLIIGLIVIVVVIVIMNRRQIWYFCHTRNNPDKIKYLATIKNFKPNNYNNSHSQNYHNQQMTNSPVIYASEYSLPTNTYNRYNNPSTYEDISFALQDFTKELESSWIKTQQVISNGTFTDVCKGILQIPKGPTKSIEVKILHHNSELKAKNEFLVEASTLGQFNHENIIKLEGVVSNYEPLMIVTEFMINGILLNYLRKKKAEISVDHQLRFLSNIAEAMKYLSHIGFVHKDLAARNILINEDLVCKISDFGLTRVLEGTNDIYCSKNNDRLSIKWSAPETVLYNVMTHQSDVWSYGVTAWEVLMYGEQPYWSWSDKEVIDAIQAGYRLPMSLPSDCPIAVHNLLLQCWNVVAQQRPSFIEIADKLDAIINGNTTLQHSAQQTCGLPNPDQSSDQTQLLMIPHSLDHGDYPINHPPQPPPPRHSIQGTMTNPDYPNRKYLVAMTSILPKKNSLNNLMAFSTNSNYSSSNYRTVNIRPNEYSQGGAFSSSSLANHQILSNPVDITIEAILRQVNLEHLAGTFQVQYGLLYAEQLQSFPPDQIELIVSQIASTKDRMKILQAFDWYLKYKNTNL